MDAMLFYKKLFEAVPTAEIDTDHHGQIIVYTNLKEVGRRPNGQPQEVVEMTDEDFDIKKEK